MDPKKIIPAQEAFLDLHFPKAGVDLSSAFCRQPNRDIGQGDYQRSAVAGFNVRGFDASLNRGRGGSRAGLVKYVAGRIGIREFVVQELVLLSSTAYAATGGGVAQTSQSGRVVTLVAVSRGMVFSAQAGDPTWTYSVNGTSEIPPLNYSGVVFSAANNQKLYFADGINYVYYDPKDNTVHEWVATAGTLPIDSENNTPRLICTWRGRTVLSGLVKDPQNWFMSAVSNPNDFDYGPLSTTPTQAVAGNNSPLGFVGDTINTLIPYSDDVLIFGGDHTIYMMRGDPMSGGQIDLISDVIGMPFGMPWCKDPFGNVYFVSNRMGIYTLIPGQQPQRISQGIEQTLQQIDTGANSIRCVWDDRFQGLHVFVTLLADTTSCTHFFYETRSGAWWFDRFANNNHNPLCCCTFDGNGPDDRVPLIGSWDGYVRAISPSATTDDGTPIASTVTIGPILTKDMDEVKVKEMQAALGLASGDITYEVLVAPTAEQAYQASAEVSGTWVAGRNLTDPILRAGHAIYVRLSSVVQWSMESIRVLIMLQGSTRRRGY